MGRAESCFWWHSQIIDLDIEILNIFYGGMEPFLAVWIIFLKHKKQCSFTRNDNKISFMYSMCSIKAALWALQKRADNLNEVFFHTISVFLSEQTQKEAGVQQECPGTLVSLCTTGDCSQL